MPVQKMSPIYGTSVLATLEHMAQFIDKIPKSRRDKAIETGIETYNSEIARDLLAHYSTDGGTPLTWAGSACAHFDLSPGDVASGAKKDLLALQRIFLDGVHPTEVNEAGRPVPLRRRQRDDAVRAFGFIHAFPKPQGLLTLYESLILQDRIESIHQRTNAYFLDFLENMACDVSIVLEPNETYRCLGLVAIMATHHSSSKADPHPHDHFLVANMTPVEITITHPDGTTSVRIEYRTLDSRLLDRMRFAAGEAATQFMRHLIEQELGLKTEINGNITALADADLIKEFSKARRHILKLAQQQDGETAGAKSDELLWLMTRRGKASADIERAFDAAWNDPQGRAQVRALWRAAVAESNQAWLAQIDLVGQFALENIENDPEPAGPKTPPVWTPERRAEIVTEIVEALNSRAVFSREWVLAQAIKYGEGHWETVEAEIDGELVRCKGLTEQLVDEVLLDPRVTQLQPKRDTNAFSTAETLEIQASYALALEDLATSIPKKSSFAQSEAMLLRSQNSYRGITWDVEQRAAFEAAFSGTGLVVCMGVAGSGKSTLVNAVHRSYAKSKTPVFGYAVAGAAVERLRQAAPGLKCDTVASLVMKLDAGQKLPKGARVIIDEFYQLPLIDADLITRAVKDAGGQLIMLGDPRQAQAIDGRGAGSLIAHAAREHGKLVELNMVYRIKSERIKSLAAAARVRDAKGFLKVVKEANHAVSAKVSAKVAEDIGTDAEIKEVAQPELTVRKAQLIEDHFEQIAQDLGGKWKSKKSPSAVAIAYLNDDVNDLARRIQTVRWGYEVEEGDETADLSSHGQFARIGDRVRTRYPIKPIGVFNGKEWEVKAVRENGSVILSDGKQSVNLDAEYVSEHLELAYASTGHSAQGGGWDQVYGCFRGNESSTWAYNVITRAKMELHLFAEIQIGTGDMAHFWKAILQRDDEQIAALLQAEVEVTEQAIVQARDALKPEQGGTRLNEVLEKLRLRQRQIEEPQPPQIPPLTPPLDPPIDGQLPGQGGPNL